MEADDVVDAADHSVSESDAEQTADVADVPQTQQELAAESARVEDELKALGLGAADLNPAPPSELKDDITVEMSDVRLRELQARFEVPAICHFCWLFQKELAMKAVLPDDLELALLYPQSHPTMAELLTKLCVLDDPTQRNQMKPGESFPYSVAVIGLSEYVNRIWYPAPVVPMRFGKPIKSAAAPAAATSSAAAAAVGESNGSVKDEKSASNGANGHAANGNGHANGDANGDGSDAAGADSKRSNKRKAAVGAKSKSNKKRSSAGAAAAAADDAEPADGDAANDASAADTTAATATAADAASADAEPFAVDRFDPRRLFTSNPFAPKAGGAAPRFHDLSLDLRLRVLSAFCDYRLASFPEFKAKVDAIEASEVRIEPIGTDANSSAYFCFQFDDYRIYRQHASRAPAKKVETESDSDDETPLAAKQQKKKAAAKAAKGQPTELFSIFTKNSDKKKNGAANGASSSSSAASATEADSGTVSFPIALPTSEAWRAPYAFELVSRTQSEFAALIARLQKAQKKKKHRKEKELIEALVELGEELSTSATATGKKRRPNAWGRIIDSSATATAAAADADAKSEESGAAVTSGGRRGSRGAAAAAAGGAIPPEFTRKRSSRIQEVHKDRIAAEAEAAKQYELAKVQYGVERRIELRTYGLAAIRNLISPPKPKRSKTRAPQQRSRSSSTASHVVIKTDAGLVVAPK